MLRLAKKSHDPFLAAVVQKNSSLILEIKPKRNRSISNSFLFTYSNDDKVMLLLR